MLKTLEYRSLQQGDEEDLSLLFREVSNVSKNFSYWDWKYFRNPAGHHMIIVAVDKDRIVGVTGSIPIKIKVGTNVVTSSQALDVAVMPQYRERRTFFHLEKIARELCIKRHAKFNYGLTEQNTYKIITTVLGFMGVLPIFNMTKILNPASYLRQILKYNSLVVPISFIARKTLKLLNRKNLAAPKGYGIVEVSQFDRQFDELWEREAKNYEIAVVRDSQYLNWRYVETPIPYKIFCVRKDDSVNGFLVLLHSQEDVTRGRIVDILVGNDSADIANLLLTKAINYFIDQGVDVITCWMLEHRPFFQILKNRGFVKRETPHNLVIRSLDSNLPNKVFVDPSKWYLTMGDSDYY